MKNTITLGDDEVELVNSSFMMRVFYSFVVLALLSIAISVGGKWFGKSVSLAGHTEDTTTHEIVIGNDVIAAPANAIRFQGARRDGIAERLDLYLRWPDMRGYSAETRDDFNHVGGSRRILFLTFEQRTMSRDMSGRLEPIYRSLIEGKGTSAPGGLLLYQFKANSGYLNEVLAVAESATGQPFVARCLVGPSAEESLAPCERDIHVGDNLSLTYRFPRELLQGWRAMEAAVLARAGDFVRTAHQQR
ncbi:MAG TPA: hypothetical protein VNS34_19450 [Rhizobiaceae bacterium]|nr:hypothetical protein [Rhizobiaceae bacterium]